MFAGTVIALVWINSPASASYTALRDSHSALFTAPRPVAGHLGGLLAIFFFAVGLEYKPEFVAVDLRAWPAAAVPILAASSLSWPPPAPEWPAARGRSSHQDRMRRCTAIANSPSGTQRS